MTENPNVIGWSRKDLVPKSDLINPRNEVLKRIKDQLISDHLLLAEEVIGMDISALAVAMGYVGEVDTKKILDEVGLPDLFPVIFIKGKGKKYGIDNVVIYGAVINEADHEYMVELSLMRRSLMNKLADNFVEQINLVFTGRRNPSVFYNPEFQDKNNIYLGTDSSTEKRVLLIVDHKGKYKTSSVKLPPGWESVFGKEDGELIGKPAGKGREDVDGITHAVDKEPTDRLTEFYVGMVRSQGHEDWTKAAKETVVKPVTVLKVPDQKKPGYTEAQLKEMARRQWGNDDFVVNGKGRWHEVSKTRSGKEHAGGSTQAGNVDRIIREISGDQWRSLTGNPVPGFKDRSPEVRKNESRKYWAHKTEKRNRKKSGKKK